VDIRTFIVFVFYISKKNSYFQLSNKQSIFEQPETKQKEIFIFILDLDIEDKFGEFYSDLLIL